jgi:mono/diheme cytochrome c family protein
VTAALFLAQMGTVWYVATYQEAEEPESAAGAPGKPSEPAETGAGTTTQAPAGDPAAGKAVFASAGCGACHTLADAGASGSVGPNLDQAKPAAALVVTRVTNGKGVMPSFKDRLDEKAIEDVAAYVSSVAGKSCPRSPQ